MATTRISIDINEEDHKYLKMCCAKLGVSIKEFVLEAVQEKIKYYEDEWLFKDSFDDNEGENYVLVDHEGVLHAI